VLQIAVVASKLGPAIQVGEDHVYAGTLDSRQTPAHKVDSFDRHSPEPAQSKPRPTSGQSQQQSSPRTLASLGGVGEPLGKAPLAPLGPVHGGGRLPGHGPSIGVPAIVTSEGKIGHEEDYRHTRTPSPSSPRSSPMAHAGASSDNMFNH
jgi:hypothetical protein